jgi:hypothetical protein
LLPAKQELTILGGDGNSGLVNALKDLCGNRKLLIEVATAAHKVLEIPLSHELFVSTVQSLKGDLEGGKAKKAINAKQKKGTKAADASETPPATGAPDAENQAS